MEEANKWLKRGAAKEGSASSRSVRRIMGFLSRIRPYNSVRDYNDMRRSLAVLSVGFVVGGIAGLLRQDVYHLATHAIHASTETETLP